MGDFVSTGWIDGKITLALYIVLFIVVKKGGNQEN